jgi:hypothetical protein
LAGAQGDLRARILDQSKALGAEIRKAQSDLESALEREATILRHEKKDRETLGDLFSELGLRLRGELQLPEK